MTDIVTRAEAQARGLTDYFTGRPCARGHIAPRNVKGKHCNVCARINIQAHRERMGDDAWRESERLRSLDYAKRNREKRRASSKIMMARLYKQDPKRFVRRTQAQEKRLLAENPVMVRLSQAARRAAYNVRQAGTSSDRGLTAIVRRVWEGSGEKCAACAAIGRLELDHVVAVANGGTNAESNLQFLCKPCNVSKGKRDFHEWLQSRPQPEGIAA